MTVRLGEVLVERGLLTPEQVEEVLAEQAKRGRPFGELAERLFGLDPDEVEQAWVAQYAQITRHVNASEEPVEEEVLQLISRRQAWQFRLIPLRWDGAELMVATSEQHLVRAMRFALRHISHPCYFVLSDTASLGDALTRHYPMAGMDAGSLDGDSIRSRSA